MYEKHQAQKELVMRDPIFANAKGGLGTYGLSWSVHFSNPRLARETM